MEAPGSASWRSIFLNPPNHLPRSSSSPTLLLGINPLLYTSHHFSSGMHFSPLLPILHPTHPTPLLPAAHCPSSSLALRIFFRSFQGT